MSIAPAADIVHLWTEHGTPVRLVRGAHRYRVVGAELIRTATGHDALTHPAEQLAGWSVIARAEGDLARVRVFQVQRQGAAWKLVDLEPA